MAKKKGNPVNEKGQISVNTENLFPIIKKWLYSEHDIFLRELISNSVDAITKLNRLSDMGKYKGKLEKPLVNISIDKKGSTLTIEDNGLGMTADEIKKYINQIAFSGARDFLEKYQEGKEESQIIGHFGLGFFSAYMVSDLVEIDTLSFDDKAAAVHWKCDGSTEFELSQSKRDKIGTAVILHINKDSSEFLDEDKVKGLVTKYSNFLPVEIQVNGKKANEQEALWNKAPAKTKDEEYNEFYKKLFPYTDDPLFHIHISVDYPFNLKGILYFPKIRRDLDITTQGRIKLFCNNVFVSDNIVDIIPQYLNLLQGVLDSPDIPLNISRSFLQGDPKVKKIGTHIANKIADKLKSIHKKNKEQYQKYWEDIHPFIKFGCLSEEKFFERMKDIIIFRTVDDKYLTLEEYQAEKSPDNKKVLYATDKEGQVSYINKAKSEGYTVLLLDSAIDTHFIQLIESKNSDLSFFRVDSDLENAMPGAKDKDDKKEDPDQKNLSEAFRKNLDKENLEVSLKELKDEDMSAMIVQSEFMRRMSDMSSVMQGQRSAGMLETYSLVLNSKNPVIKKILALSKDKANDDKISLLCKNVFDLALLQQNQLKGDKLEDFVKRTNRLIIDGLA